MDTKAILGILAAIIFIINGIPYLSDIHNKKISLHISSWFG
ncbi:MAG TPA: hypothetical protein PKK65_02600 [bacterium]|jgi:hypothetical protein|nr:hypothetical protein [bacterium]